MSGQNYQLLSRVELKHEYYPDGKFRNISIEPAEATARLMKRYGLLFKPDEAQFDLLYPELFDVSLVKRLSAKQPARLSFFIYSRAEAYVQFTDIPYDQLSTIYFQNRQPRRGKEGKLILKGKPGEPESGAAGLLHLYLSTFVKGKALQTKRYELSFSSRKAQWNYYFVGLNTSHCQSWTIKDEAGTRFSGPEAAEIMGQSSTHFSSGKQLYPMKEQPGDYCTIRDSQSGQQEKVIKTLPAATVKSITGTIPGPNGHQPTAVSSIYIYM